MLLLAAAGAGVVLLIILVAVLIGAPAEPFYRVTWRVVADRIHRWPELEVTVKGKPQRLAVLLTDPAGKTETEFISADDMLDGGETVTVSMVYFRHGPPQPGMYTLTVKTTDPETTVHKKTLSLAAEALLVQDCSSSSEEELEFANIPPGLDLQVGQNYGRGVVVMHKGVKMLAVPKQDAATGKR